jgi:DNA uptake protein ComE-like DNA-binding protein
VQVSGQEPPSLYRKVDLLEEIPGIGPATLEKIEPFATV